MKLKLSFSFLALIILCLIANWYFSKRVIGSGVEGLFKIGSCLRDDEFGVTYKVNGTAKGRTNAEIIKSEKYPTQEKYQIGSLENIPSDDNPRKLYPTNCP